MCLAAVSGVECDSIALVCETNIDHKRLRTIQSIIEKSFELTKTQKTEKEKSSSFICVALLPILNNGVAGLLKDKTVSTAIIL